MGLLHHLSFRNLRKGDSTLKLLSGLYGFLEHRNNTICLAISKTCKHI